MGIKTKENNKTAPKLSFEADKELIARINEYATMTDRSVSASIRVLVNLGLEEVKTR